MSGCLIGYNQGGNLVEDVSLVYTLMWESRVGGYLDTPITIQTQVY